MHFHDWDMTNRPDSMWPLLKRDGLAVQYIALVFLWNRLIGYNPFRHTYALVKFLVLLHINVAADGYVPTAGVCCMHTAASRRANSITTRAIPRHIRCAQCACLHTDFRADLAVEHQIYYGSSLGCWWSRDGTRKRRPPK